MDYTVSIFSSNWIKSLKIFIFSSLLIFSLAQGNVRACTLKDAQAQFSTLNKLFQIYHQERTSYKKLGQKIPAELTTKQRELSKTSARIRKLFAVEVEKKNNLQASDLVNADICNHYNRLMETHAGGLDIKRTTTVLLPAIEKEKQPVCDKKNIRKRFGIAVRKQRKLTIAGKINRKEQISYLKMATKFIKNAKSDFKKACHNLHQYEKHLASEKRDDQDG